MTTPAHPGPGPGLDSSPYLRRHAAQPVAWQAWGPEAISRARALGRPILLQIGQASSLACRAMERDCFEDPATASALNDAFVCVLVDAEQRPDLDRCYQAAHELLTREPEGWPLTLFLAPEDLLPFFGGTRLGTAAARGQPGLRELLPRIAQYYRERRGEVIAQNAALRSSLETSRPPAAPQDEVLDDRVRRASRQALEQQFDRRAGGFGQAPKHPYPVTLERLLRDWRRTATEVEPDLQALYMVALTLTRVAEGGLRDAGGAFFQHALDAEWRVPRLELRLGDNAALLAIYAQAAIATGDPLFARVAGESADWLLRVLRAPDGAFQAGLQPDGTIDPQVTARGNAQAIRGLALAARALHRTDLTDAALGAMDALRRSLFRDGRLRAAADAGSGADEALPRAPLDDHALLADAALELAQLHWRDADLRLARELLETVITHFEDPALGGFFLTPDDQEPLVHRPKSFADGAAPSGNGIAARALIRTGWLCSEPRLLAAAERALRAAWPSMQRHPLAHASMIGALEEWLEPPEIVVLRGDAAAAAGWRDELGRLYAPSRMIFAVPTGSRELTDGPAGAEGPGPGTVVAMIHRGGERSGPLHSLERLARDLRLGLGHEPGAETPGE